MNETLDKSLQLKKIEPIKQEIKEDIFTLSHGDIILQWPDCFTEEEYQDVEKWLDLIKKKLKRYVMPLMCIDTVDTKTSMKLKDAFEKISKIGV